MNRKQWLAALLMLFATFLWGSTFVAQKQGSDAVGTFTFSAARSVVATVALFALALFRTLKKKKQPQTEENRENAHPVRHHLLIGLLCGIALTVASVFQQAGIADPEVSTAQSGFLTALYVILVPICGIFLGRKPGRGIWLGCILGLAGMFLLCCGGAGLAGILHISRGSVYLLLCAVGYTVHILLLDRFSPGCDSIWLSCIQFATMTLLCIPGAIAEHNTLAQYRAALVPILYAGILSSGVAYTIQVYTQKLLHPALASIIMCFESVFALLCGWWVLGEKPGSVEFVGCLLVFVGLLVAQFDPFRLFRKKGNLS